RTQNLAANKYKGEGMEQENSSIILTWLPKNPVMKFKNTSYDHFNVWSLNYKHSNHYYNTIYITLEEVGFFFSFARILILLTFFKQEFCTKTSSVRPALEPDIDLEELEVHYSSFLEHRNMIFLLLPFFI
ncbi:hypothetical protein ACJX0J_029952, partial [Zea mays]